MGGSCPLIGRTRTAAASSPAVAIIHDWWGITTVERRIAHLFAQMGYCVIVLISATAASPPRRRKQFNWSKRPRSTTIKFVDTSLRALETHVRVNGKVAAVGLGMGGTLA